MEIKGTAVKSIQDFVKKNFPAQYKEWENTLPADSKKIFCDAILATDWYPLQAGGVAPTRHVARFYGNNTKKAAWEMGRYSAELALTGIYKVFIKVATPAFIIDRASKIIETYYRPAELKVVERPAKGVVLHILNFPGLDSVIEYRICGWIERALEINNLKSIKIDIPQSITKGNKISEFRISWD